MGGYTHDSISLVENFDVSLHAQRYGIGDKKSLTILVFILDYFQKKLMTKFFKRSKKKHFWTIVGVFCLTLGKNEFSWKKRLIFKYSNYISHCAKNQKKLMTHSSENCRTDERTDNGDFIGPSVGRVFDNILEETSKNYYYELNE